MDYVRFGNTGLRVSRICLGCMSYGDPTLGSHSWAIDEDAAQPFYRKAFELGINFFDTANAYSQGTSEEILGRAIRTHGGRDRMVIATKLFFPLVRDDPNSRGLSRKSIFREIDASLKRLGMDYVDLYQIHRWDYETPLEETLEALHDVVKSGRVRYLGASSMFAWQFARALYLADHHGWTRFASMQPQYNLLYREEER
jgi:1-deoxyxylulose-5-phosphate synthase